MPGASSGTAATVEWVNCYDNRCSPQSLTLLDGSERESRPDPDSFGYIPNERNIFLEQVNPGVAKEGTVIFTVAPDASGFRLQVGDANLFSNQEAFVDLGF